MADDEIYTQMGRTSRVSSISSNESIPDVSRSSTHDYNDDMHVISDHDEARVMSSYDETDAQSTQEEPRLLSSQDEARTMSNHDLSALADFSLELTSENTDISLMSEREIQDWDKRMGEMVARMQQQRNNYEQWETSLNNRRLIAFERLKNMNLYHQKRLELYSSVGTYINDLKAVLNNTTDSEKSMAKE